MGNKYVALVEGWPEPDDSWVLESVYDSLEDAWLHAAPGLKVDEEQTDLTVM